MPVSDAIDDVMETRLGKTKPGCVIKHFVVDVLRRSRIRDGENDSKRQPEQNKSQEAVKITSDQRKVRLVHGTLLEAWLAHEFFGIDDDSNVNKKCDEQRQ